MPTPTRHIELAQLHSGGTWATVFVDIPATTHESKVVEVAIAAGSAKYGPGLYCIYNTYDDDVPEVPGAFIIEVQDDARCVQRFLVEGCADEEEALEKMGEGKREQWGPDETLSWLGSSDDEYDVSPFG